MLARELYVAKNPCPSHFCHHCAIPTEINEEKRFGAWDQLFRMHAKAVDYHTAIVTASINICFNYVSYHPNDTEK